MQINHIKLYKDELPSSVWESYLSMDHAIISEEEDFIMFHTLPEQTSSELFTVSCYSFGIDSPVIGGLIEHGQEECMLDMSEVIRYLEAYKEDFEDFKKQVNLSADNCLLVQGW